MASAKPAPSASRTKRKTPSPNSDLVVNIDAQVEAVNAAELAAKGDQLLDRLKQDASHASVQLNRSLLRAKADDRLAAADFVAGVPPGVGWRGPDGAPRPDAVHAVGSLLAYDPADLPGTEGGRALMTDVLALKHGENPDDAAAAASALMKAAGYKSVSPAKLAAEARKRRAEFVKQAAAAGQTGQTVRSVLPDAPVGDAVVLPAGYGVSAAGIVGPDGGPVALRPVVLSEVGEDVQTGVRTVTVAWADGPGRWVSRTVPRAAIADARAVVAELAGHGCPVNSNTARALVGYLAAFEYCNAGVLPTVGVSARLGWQRGMTGFLWGTTYVTAERRFGPDDRGDRVVFRGADAGDDQVAAGFHARGDLAGWRGAVAPVGGFPNVVFSLYAGFVPVMAEVFGVSNFVVSLAGETSTGKTTTLGVAASAWGCPDDRRPETVVRNFNSTAVFRDRVAAVTGNMPLLFDETQAAQKDEDVRDMLYAVCQGQAKARGSVAGLAKQPTITTVLLMTGERPATAFSEEGGTRARVLEFWGSPFAGAADGAGLVHALAEGVAEHYGHAGPAFVEYVLRRRDEWPAWRARYREKAAELRGRAPGGPAARMAQYLAAVAVVAEIAHAALGLPWSFTDPVAPVFDELIAGAADADRATAALEYIAAWAQSHDSDFRPNDWKDGDRVPPGGWVGYKLGGTPGNTTVFVPHKLDEALRDGGFDPKATVRCWRDRGWLDTDKDAKGRSHKTHRVRGDGCVKTVSIKNSAIAGVVGKPDPDPAPAHAPDPGAATPWSDDEDDIDAEPEHAGG